MQHAQLNANRPNVTKADRNSDLTEGALVSSSSTANFPRTHRQSLINPTTPSTMDSASRQVGMLRRSTRISTSISSRRVLRRSELNSRITKNPSSGIPSSSAILDANGLSTVRAERSYNSQPQNGPSFLLSNHCNDSSTRSVPYTNTQIANNLIPNLDAESFRDLQDPSPLSSGPLVSPPSSSYAHNAGNSLHHEGSMQTMRHKILKPNNVPFRYQVRPTNESSHSALRSSCTVANQNTAGACSFHSQQSVLHGRNAYNSIHTKEAARPESFSQYKGPGTSNGNSANSRYMLRQPTSEQPSSIARAPTQCHYTSQRPLLPASSNSAASLPKLTTPSFDPSLHSHQSIPPQVSDAEGSIKEAPTIPHSHCLLPNDYIQNTERKFHDRQSFDSARQVVTSLPSARTSTVNITEAVVEEVEVDVTVSPTERTNSSLQASVPCSADKLSSFTLSNATPTKITEENSSKQCVAKVTGSKTPMPGDSSETALCTSSAVTPTPESQTLKAPALQPASRSASGIATNHFPSRIATSELPSSPSELNPAHLANQSVASGQIPSPFDQGSRVAEDMTSSPDFSSRTVSLPISISFTVIPNTKACAPRQRSMLKPLRSVPPSSKLLNSLPANEEHALPEHKDSTPSHKEELTVRKTELECPSKQFSPSTAGVQDPALTPSKQNTPLQDRTVKNVPSSSRKNGELDCKEKKRYQGKSKKPSSSLSSMELNLQKRISKRKQLMESGNEEKGAIQSCKKLKSINRYHSSKPTEPPGRPGANVKSDSQTGSKKDLFSSRSTKPTSLIPPPLTFSSTKHIEKPLDSSTQGDACARPSPADQPNLPGIKELDSAKSIRDGVTLVGHGTSPTDLTDLRETKKHVVANQPISHPSVINSLSSHGKPDDDEESQLPEAPIKSNELSDGRETKFSNAVPISPLDPHVAKEKNATEYDACKKQGGVEKEDDTTKNFKIRADRKTTALGSTKNGHSTSKQCEPVKSCRKSMRVIQQTGTDVEHGKDDIRAVVHRDTESSARHTLSKRSVYTVAPAVPTTSKVRSVLLHLRIRRPAMVPPDTGEAGPSWMIGSGSRAGPSLMPAMVHRATKDPSTSAVKPCLARPGARFHARRKAVTFADDGQAPQKQANAELGEEVTRGNLSQDASGLNRESRINETGLSLIDAAAFRAAAMRPVSETVPVSPQAPLPSCNLCCETLIDAVSHPLFDVRFLRICQSCRRSVLERVTLRNEIGTSPGTNPEAEIGGMKADFFVAVVENMVLSSPRSERGSSKVSTAFDAVTERPRQYVLDRMRRLFVSHDMVVITRALLTRLGVRLHDGRLCWPIERFEMAPYDAIDVVRNAWPQTMDDLESGFSRSDIAWSKIFPNLKLDDQSYSCEIIENVLSLIGVRVKRGAQCKHDHNGMCQVDVDLCSVLASMLQAAGWATDHEVTALFAHNWMKKDSLYSLRGDDILRASYDLPDNLLIDGCCICGMTYHEHRYPLRYEECSDCKRRFCSPCLTNVLGGMEYIAAFFKDSYLCALCRFRKNRAIIPAEALPENSRVDAPATEVEAGCPDDIRTLATAEESGKRVRTLLPLKISGRSSQPKKKASQPPLLKLSVKTRRNLLGFALTQHDVLGPAKQIHKRRNTSSLSAVGLAKLCEVVNDRTLSGKSLPRCENESICMRCKIPGNKVGEDDGGESDDIEVVETGIERNLGVVQCSVNQCDNVVHHRCLTEKELGRLEVTQSKKRKGRNEKWRCSHHYCIKCDGKDEVKMLRCRTCPVAFCREHVPPMNTVSLYTDRLITCEECQDGLATPKHSWSGSGWGRGRKMRSRSAVALGLNIMASQARGELRNLTENK